MSANSRITNAYENAFCLPLNPSSKYVLFSDCHRGTGRSNDNFLKNEYLYLAALKYYFSHGFTYIELVTAMNFGKTAPCARFAKCMPKVLNCSPAFMRNTGFTPSTVATILPNAVPTLADVVFLRASAGRSSVKSRCFPKLHFIPELF